MKDPDRDPEVERDDINREANGGNEEEGYRVGYGRPPKHTRFQPGESGNKRGRPKGARGLKTDLRTALSGRHTIQINGRPLRGNRQELMMLTLATRAASGDLRAQGLLIPLILQVLGASAGEGDQQCLSARDQALLNQLVDEFSGSSSEDSDGARPPLGSSDGGEKRDD